MPPSWDRRYRRWAWQAVRTGRLPAADRTGDGIAAAALLAVRVATLSAAAGLGAALLCNLGLAAGVIGMVLATFLCWWWMAKAIAFISRQ